MDHIFEAIGQVYLRPLNMSVAISPTISFFVTNNFMVIDAKQIVKLWLSGARKYD